MNRPCQTLIVDDSASFRAEISAALKDVPGISVAGTAHDGQMALEMLEKGDFQLVILDLEMPRMNGIDLLKELEKRKLRARVIVFSSHSEQGARITLEALRHGAHDFTIKPAFRADKSPREAIRESLTPKLKAFLQAPVAALSPTVKKGLPVNFTFFDPKIVVIASSTGGPRALESIFGRWKDLKTCPIVITQHMPPMFTRFLAETLGKLSGLPSAEARDGEALERGKIYIAPGDFHLALEKSGDRVLAKLAQGPARNSVRPSADFLFETAAKIYGKNTLGMVLSGMGSDGLEGATRIKENRGAIVTQNESSCAVYGMPRTVDEAGLSDKSGTPSELAEFLYTVLKRS